MSLDKLSKIETESDRYPYSLADVERWRERLQLLKAAGEDNLKRTFDKMIFIG